MTDVVRTLIPEAVVLDGKRLGRHLEHDPRSRSFPADKATALHDIAHKRHSPPFDQGQLGSCTGNAVAGALDTEPIWKTGDPLMNEAAALKIYELATTLDEFAGSYPPDDTGSSGLAACKAARELGLLTSYRHAFGVDHALHALMLHPEVTGVNWYEGFDRPDANGLVKIAGAVRGGHEFEVAELINAAAGLDALVACWQSWGPGYGKSGKFYMTVRTWGELLAEGGDVTVPIRSH